MSRTLLNGLAAAKAAAAIILTGLTVCAAGSFDAARSDGAVAPIQIAFVANNASDYWLIAEAGANRAQKELGSRVQVNFGMPSDGSVAVQEAMVENYIKSGVRAIALSPVDAEKQTGWINHICGKVRLITQDSDAPQSERLAYLGTDNHAAGLLAGQYIKKALPNGGKIELFAGNRVAQNTRAREQGIRDALQGSKIEILDVLCDETDRTLAKSNADAAMAQHPDLAMEVGLYSYHGPIILEAVREAHRVGKVKIVCFDQEKATLAGIDSGAIYATIVQQPYQFGYEGCKLLAKLAEGDLSGLPKNKTLYFPAVAVTPSTLKAYVAELNKETGKSWGSGN